MRWKQIYIKNNRRLMGAYACYAGQAHAVATAQAKQEQERQCCRVHAALGLPDQEMVVCVDVDQACQCPTGACGGDTSTVLALHGVCVAGLHW